MKMNQKSSSKIRIFSKTDSLLFILAQLVCILLIIVGLLEFHKGFYISLSKIKEEPVAVVSGKIKDSRRCLEKRSIWDRLQLNTPIYNGDTIKTESNSQATLRFSDGLELTLSPNTMTQIKVGKDNKLEVFLSKGDLLIDSLQNSNSATIVYNNTNITTSGKAMVSAIEVTKGENVDKSEKNLEVQVLDGKAELKSQGKENVEVQVGQMVTLKVNKETKKEKLTEVKNISENKEAVPVTVLVETPKKRETKKITKESVLLTPKVSEVLETEKTVVKEKQEKKSYSIFKVPEVQKTMAAITNDEPLESKQTVTKKVNKPKKQPSQNKNEVIKTEKVPVALGSVMLNSPEKNKVFNDSYFMTKQQIDFSWKKVDNATNYQFVLKNPAGKKITDIRLSNTDSYSFKDLSMLQNGTFVWSVQSLKCDKNGKVLESGEIKTSSFSIRLGEISGTVTTGNQMYGNDKR